MRYKVKLFDTYFRIENFLNEFPGDIKFINIVNVTNYNTSGLEYRLLVVIGYKTLF